MNSPLPSDPYERPDCRHRCGRAAGWGKPCGEGPNSDGTCSQTERPCVPRSTLRILRGRITLLASLITTLLLAAGFHFGSGGRKHPAAADPGPLSSSHAAFTAETGCVACHAHHDQGLAALVKSLNAPHNFNRDCSVCHQFAGPPQAPHNNAALIPTRGHRETDCRHCHTEHRGALADITPLTGEQCQSCHKQTFHRFDLDHPPFPKNFPHRVPATVRFDHTSHYKEHFQKPEHLAGPAITCATCHSAHKDRTDIATLGFDVACARCHEDQIRQSELTLLRLPDPVAEAQELDPVDATPFMRTKLADAPTAPAYGERLHAWLTELSKDGPAALLENPTTPAQSANLVAGLSPDLLAQTLKTWLKRETPELSPDAPPSGWYWFDDLTPELRYRPSGHSDAAVRAWLERARSGTTNAFFAELHHPQTGPGRCAKCHVLEEPSSVVSWTYPERPAKPQVRFSHGMHLGVRDCTDCHSLDASVDYEQQFHSALSPPLSNFRSLTTATCTTCHAENKVRHDCRLCHRYHSSPQTSARLTKKSYGEEK